MVLQYGIKESLHGEDCLGNKSHVPYQKYGVLEMKNLRLEKGRVYSLSRVRGIKCINMPIQDQNGNANRGTGDLVSKCCTLDATYEEFRNWQKWASKHILAF